MSKEQMRGNKGESGKEGRPEHAGQAGSFPCRPQLRKRTSCGLVTWNILERLCGATVSQKVASVLRERPRATTHPHPSL